MATLRQWFSEFTEATGERPTAVMLGWYKWDYQSESWPIVPNRVVPINVVGADVLDREFDDGYGGNDSPNLCAWSDNWVLFSDNYDGAESLQWVPRNPVDHEPIRPGGG